MAAVARADDDTWDLATSVGSMATGVAVARALASRGPDAAIDDPFAEPLVRAVGVGFFTRIAGGELDPADIDDDDSLFGMRRMREMMGVRTFSDDFFLRATDAGVPQAVILACGLDACLPAVLAGRDDGLRDRPAPGHQFQDAGRTGRKAHCTAPRGGHRPAWRLANRVAQRRF